MKNAILVHAVHCTQPDRVSLQAKSVPDFLTELQGG